MSVMPADTDEHITDKQLDSQHAHYTASDHSRDDSPDDHVEIPSLPAKLATRVDLHVVPTLVAIYIMAFLDRVNISNAVLYGMQEDLNMHGNQFNAAVAYLFITYVTCEIPAAIIMKKTNPQYFLPTCATAFGILLTLHGVVNSYAALVTLRVLAGIFEAGVYPACWYLISMWYTRRETQKRMAFFYSGCSLAGAFGSLIASGIGRLDGVGGYRAWRWVFIIEGLISVLIGVVSFFTVTHFPESAGWISEPERRLIVNRLKADQGDSGIDEPVGFKDLLLIVKDWRVLLSGPLYFGIAASIYGLAFFIPTIISTYGFSPVQAQLHSVIPWAVSFVWTLAIAYLSDRFQIRSPFVIFCLILSLVGNLMLFNIHTNQQAEFAAIFLYLMGVVGSTPVFVCWYTMNLRGHRERAVGVPYMVGLGNASGLVGAFAFPASDSPRYKLGYSLGLGLLLSSLVMSFIYLIGYMLQNKRRARSERFML